MLAGAAAAGCGAEREANEAVGSAQVTVDTVNGVQVVTSIGVPAEWGREPLAVIERPRDEEFGRIVGVVADSAGNVYVADDIAKRIYRFSPTGEYLGAIGREGGGPGEFRALKGLAWVGPYLATMDAGNGRITTVALDGRPGPDVRWLALTGTGFWLEQTAPGEAYALLPVFSGDRGGGNTRVYLRITAQGVADTLPGRQLAPLPGSEGIVCEGGPDGGIRFFAVPEASQPFAARAPGRRTLLGYTGQYRLAVVSADGDTVRVIRRELANPPLTDSVWAVTDSMWTAFQEGARGSTCTRSSIERPASLPAFAGAFHDDRGRLWVEARDSAGYRFDVFDSTGALLGQLPPHVRDRRVPPYVRDGRLYYVSLDDMDVQSVRVARIVEFTPAHR